MLFISDRRKKEAAPCRLVTYGWLALALQGIMLAIFVVRFYALHDWRSPMVGTDFVVFWSAARVTIQHGAAAVFSVSWMQPIEEALWHCRNFAPWPYPPTFLLLVLPFGLLPFPAALALFSVIGLGAYRVVFRRIVRNMDAALIPTLAAFPGVTVAIAMGQNSLFTIVAAGAALAMLETNAAVAGGCIALLAIKPQFGVLFPWRWRVVDIGKRWRQPLSTRLHFSPSAQSCLAATYGLRLPRFCRNSTGLW